MSPTSGFLRRALFLAWAALAWPGAAASQTSAPLEDVAARTISDYTRRIEQAAADLEDARMRITGQKAPAHARLQSLERAILSLQSEVAMLEETRAQADERGKRLQREAQALTKNVAYLQTLAQDLLRAAETGYAPGEDAAAIAALRQDFERHPTGSVDTAIQAVHLATTRIETQVGGHTATGQAISAATNRTVAGTFGHFGPQTIFVAQDGSIAGAVVAREGSPYPIVHPLARWPAPDAPALAQGREVPVLLDPTNGKALALRRTTGSYWEHVERGGIMAFVIIATGAAAAMLALQKLWEQRSLKIDPPPAVKAALAGFASLSPEEATAAAGRLQGATRGLFLAGARHLGHSKDVIEEQLYAYTMGQRLHYEKRLPLLAVIATAAPLMGLLGTVMGMVKTFALITVFGTGNAAKLSSGISEILVTTELGLAVAIPALVAHGFLTHRIQKKLSQLERHAVEILATVSQARNRDATAEPVSP